MTESEHYKKGFRLVSSKLRELKLSMYEEKNYEEGLKDALKYKAYLSNIKKCYQSLCHQLLLDTSKLSEEGIIELSSKLSRNYRIAKEAYNKCFWIHSKLYEDDPIKFKKCNEILDVRVSAFNLEHKRLSHYVAHREKESEEAKNGR